MLLIPILIIILIVSGHRELRRLAVQVDCGRDPVADVDPRKPK